MWQASRHCIFCGLSSVRNTIRANPLVDEDARLGGLLERTVVDLLAINDYNRARFKKKQACTLTSRRTLAISSGTQAELFWRQNGTFVDIFHGSELHQMPNRRFTSRTNTTSWTAITTPLAAPKLLPNEMLRSAQSRIIIPSRRGNN